MVTRVVHLSTAHGRRELRVHLKECNSLAAAGYQVHYIVADGLGVEIVGDVTVHDVGVSGGRFQRMLLRPWRMLALALALDARLYHFHDPELLLIALFLSRDGAKVVYDSHEDVPRSLLSRDWIPARIRPVLSAAFELFENFISRRLSAIVGATPHIAARFLRLNATTVDINNYPLRSEIENTVEPTGHSRSVCYLGGITRIRGIESMVYALEHTKASLILAGPFDTPETAKAVSLLAGWANVDYRGNVSRTEVLEIMAASCAGLILYHPEPNHVDAQPNKLFEYMSSGLPVIASDFPLWREIVEENDCGLCVDPFDHEAIAAAIDFMIDNPLRAVEMGENGRAAVIRKYNWSVEEQKLVELYGNLLAE